MSRLSVACLAGILWLSSVAGGYVIRKNGVSNSRAPINSAAVTASSLPDTLNEGTNYHRTNYSNTLAAAGADRMEELFAEYDAISDPADRSAAIDRLIARWVELDAEAALQFFTTRNIRSEVVSVLTHWAMEDPVAAGSAVQMGSNAWKLLPDVWNRLARIDAGSIVGFLEAIPPSVTFAELLSSTGWRGNVARMAGADFDGTVRLAGRMAEGSDFEPSQVLAAIAAGRAVADPDGALEWARSLDKGSQGAIHAVLHEIASQDPPKAAREWLAEEWKIPARFGDSSGSLVLEIGVQLAKTDPAAALRWIREAVGGLEGGQRLVQETASRILQAALREPGRLTDTFPVIAGDLDAGAFLFPSYVPAGRLGTLLEAVSALPAGEARDRLLANLAVQESTSNPVASLNWLNQIADPQAREAFARGVSVPQSPEAAAQARQLYEALPPDLQSSAAGRLAQTQAAQNPMEAAAWAQTLSDSAARQNALRSALDIWALRGSAAASGWVNELPAGPERDAAASGLIRGIADREPSSAFIWALNIGDAAQQETSLRVTLDRWRKADPAAATAAVEAAALPEIRRKELLDFIHSTEPWNDPTN